jgi:hypothetical protein
MRCALLACVVFFGVWGFADDARAGEKEEAVMAGCSATASTGVGYAGCVAAGWAGQAVNTCLTQPQKCWGETERNCFARLESVAAVCSRSRTVDPSFSVQRWM